MAYQVLDIRYPSFYMASSASMCRIRYIVRHCIIQVIILSGTQQDVPQLLTLLAQVSY